VGITIADEAQHLIATLSLLVIGARQVTLATHEKPSLLEETIRRVGVTVVLSDDESFAITGLDFLLWNRDRVQAATETTSRTLPHVSTATLFLKTSGTTGTMNIVEFSEAQIAAQSQRHADYADERLLRLASIEHNNSKRHRLYCTWAGGTNIFRHSGTVNVVQFVLDHGVTCLDISRMHAADLATVEDARRLAGVKLRTGGSAVPFGVRDAIEKAVTKQLYVRYASTESGAISAALPGDHDSDESSGRPMASVELQIVDASGEVCAAGESGEIRLRAPGMATGYFDTPEQSAKRFRGGWFYPGDVGRLREDGQLVVLGRGDDMIIMNGINIFPAEIERILEQHPAVAVAAALPIASDVHGQIPVAAVELKPGAQVTAAELLAYSREFLALRAPRRILIMESLPRNAPGKIVKREIATAFSAKGAAK
jgi:acyl-coenzyme A synthetase/AMP-(fatty) acid ligase